jgi:mannose-1-phosphate guanylyltransferase
VINSIEPGKLVSMEKQIFPQIIQNTGRFFGFKFQGHWIDVGRISSYISVHRLLLEKQKKTFLAGDQCTIQGKLKYSCAGNQVSIGKNAAIESSILFDHVSIGENVILDHCVIGENCEIGEGSVLRNVAVGDNERIDNHTQRENTVVWNQPIPQGYPNKQIGNVIGE